MKILEQKQILTNNKFDSDECLTFLESMGKIVEIASQL
jgi:hypothetical protein